MMAMELQSKNCLPGYSLMTDLNKDPDDNWSGYYVEELNNHLCDNHTQRLVNGCLAYDKEILKQTMLEHEAIFRKQVYELHRLYIIQKDMMYEFQTRGLNKSFVPEETSQSNSFSSQLRSESSQIIWHSAHSPVVKNYCDNLLLVGGHGLRRRLSFIKEGSVQSGVVPTKNSPSIKKTGFVDHKVENQSRIMIDLGLSGGAYTDLNDADTSEKKDAVESLVYLAGVPFRTGNLESKLKLDNAEANSSRKDECLLGLSTRNIMMTEKTSALNKFTTKTCAVGPEESSSVQLFGMKHHIERNLEHNLTMRSHENGEYGHISKLSVSYFRNSNGETSGLFPLLTGNEFGRRGKGLDIFSESLYSERLSMPSGPSQLNLKKNHENNALDSNKLEIWFKKKPANAVETSDVGSHNALSNKFGSVFPFMPASFPVPQKNFASLPSSFALSGTKSMNVTSHLEIPVGEIPCLNTSLDSSTKGVMTNAAPQNAVTSSKIQQNNYNLPSCQGNSVNDSFCNTEPYHSFDLNSSDAQPIFLAKKLKCMDSANDSNCGNLGHQPTRSVKDLQCRSLPVLREINLNQAPSTCYDLREQEGLLVENKTKDSSRIPSWLRKTVYSKQPFDLNSLASDIEHSFSEDYVELPITNFSTTNDIEEDKKTSHCSNASLQAIDQKTQQIMASECTNKRPCSPLIPEKTQKINVAPPVSRVEKSLTNRLKTTENDGFLYRLQFDQDMSSSEVFSAESSEKKEKVGTNYRNLINLNIELPTCDEEELPNSEVEFRTSDSSQTTSSKIALESQICQGDGSIISHCESTQSGERSSLVTEGSCDMLARLAAENIVAISMHKISHQDEVDCRLSSPFDSLHLFVDVALSMNKGTKAPSGLNGGYRFSDNDGSDLFEAMTLALKEVKIHDLSKMPNEPINKGRTDEEDIGAASQLFTRRRRGQARRRRQRKDFQKDILPSLVSLSRHEVTEDLQLIGDLMKACGRSWQSGLGRRNSCRNDANSRAKGKRQLTNCFATTTYSINEPEVVGTSMIGWGRTTRRCRRQKTLPSNVVSSMV